MVYVGLFLLTILIAFLVFLQTGIQLPSHIPDLIKEVQSQPLPALIQGETGQANNGTISLFYEVLGNKESSKGTILLILGHTQTLLDWLPHFYEPLVAAGYRVIRYDNRGIGQSSWVKDWGKPNKYTLEDMALDALAVLDAVGVQQAHIIGQSMGGMIGQRLAISHGERVLSLTSIMSSGYYFDPQLRDVPPPFLRNIIRLLMRYRPAKGDETRKLKYHIGIHYLLKGKGAYPAGERMILQRILYELRQRKGFNYKGADQHSYAIKASGSRYEGLKKLNLPVLVIHGTTDPLIDFNHAPTYAQLIPNAQTFFIEGMGHDLPKVFMGEMMEGVFGNIGLAQSII